jgi:hypothetical protein
MEHRYYTKEDYPQLVTWWQDWGWAAFPEMALPKTGIIVSKDGVDLAASFLYTTDSCVCWAENFISNKKAPRHLRKGAVDFLIEKTIEEAKNQGFLIMMSSVQHEGLIKKLLNAGYDKNIETGMTNLTRVL